MNHKPVINLSNNTITDVARYRVGQRMLKERKRASEIFEALYERPDVVQAEVDLIVSELTPKPH